jgi:hypothetical protein
MAEAVSYERQKRANEIKSADALCRIAVVLEKMLEHMTGKPEATVEPLVSETGHALVSEPQEDSNEP